MKKLSSLKTVTRGTLAVSLMLALTACDAQKDGLATATPFAPDSSGSASATGQVPAPLVGLWKLDSLQEPGHTPVGVASPERFTVSFGSQGPVDVVADCNRCSGTVTVTDQNLKIGVMACTLAFCSTAPYDTKFSGLVGASTAWSVSADTLSLVSSSGTLRMKR